MVTDRMESNQAEYCFYERHRDIRRRKENEDENRFAGVRIYLLQAPI